MTHRLRSVFPALGREGGRFIAGKDSELQEMVIHVGGLRVGCPLATGPFILYYMKFTHASNFESDGMAAQ